MASSRLQQRTGKSDQDGKSSSSMLTEAELLAGGLDPLVLASKVLRDRSADAAHVGGLEGIARLVVACKER